MAASLSQRLDGHQTVGLDTSVFIYHLEAHPQYVSLTRELLSTIRDSKWRGVTSTVTLMELTVRAWEESRPDLASAYEIFLSRFPHLLLADVTRAAARGAARLRAEYRLRPADALQLGTALVHAATAFVTNDRTLARVAPEMDVVLLSDFAAP